MKKLYHLFRYKLQVKLPRFCFAKSPLQNLKGIYCKVRPYNSPFSTFNFQLSILIFAFYLLPTAAFAQATVTGVLYSCPEKVTVTYNLNSDCPVNLTLQYSHDCVAWTEAIEVEGDLEDQTGTGTETKTIIWNNADEGDDGVIFGKFYFKVTYPGSDDLQEPVEHDYVQIGPLKWATTNLAEPYTFAASPTDTGWYYQWSINVGWRPYPNTPLLNSDGGSTWITTINNNMPQGWVCDQPCPAGWRLPTRAENVTLANYVVPVSSGLDRLNGINGRFFDSGDPCQPLLFLPAAGGRDFSGGSLGSVGTYGFYWSSTQSSTTSAYYLSFVSTSVLPSNNDGKTYGFSVRCVSEL